MAALSRSEAEERAPSPVTVDLRESGVRALNAELHAPTAAAYEVLNPLGAHSIGAGIAHEIGNPLGAIHGYLHIARVRGGEVPGIAEALDGLERESLRIDRIVRGLLDYARPRRVTPTPIDMNDVVRALGISTVVVLPAPELDASVLRRISWTASRVSSVSPDWLTAT